MSRPFLTARWEDLVLVTYRVPDDLLAGRLAPGLELDRYEGRACVSLVAFRFLDTRVFGVRWPFYTNFAEVNLRFYVREGERRGVKFVREYVPRRAISIMARRRYNEPYAYAPMAHEVGTWDSARHASYTVRYGGREHRIGAMSESDSHTPNEGSPEHFFKEHQWGYGVSRRGRLLRYEVNHPVWRVHRVRSHIVEVDWAMLYGDEWGILQGEEPISVVHAVGSEVTVCPCREVG